MEWPVDGEKSCMSHVNTCLIKKEIEVGQSDNNDVMYV
jgi:hypothetical protein